MLTFETIRKIYEKEKESEKLAELPENFFEELKTYLSRKTKMIKTEENKWEVESIKRRVQTIFEIRERKILNASLYHVRSGITPDNMIPEEKTLFNNVVKAVQEFQKLRKDKMDAKEERDVVVSILSDIPRFVGIDMESYGPFKEGDVATLPEPNADLLIKKGLAEAIHVKDI